MQENLTGLQCSRRTSFGGTFPSTMNDQDRLKQPPVALNRAKERVVDRLRAHYVRDDIDVDEYETLVDVAWAATEPADLDRLLSRLPVLVDEESTALTTASGTVPAPLVASAGEVREHGFQIAILSGSDKKGSWVPPQKLTSIALMGGLGLDFREAKFGPGVTEVTILTIMGGAGIIVPPGINVETSGIGIMGGFDSYDQTVLVADPSAPVLRIRGLAIMGGVEVKMLLPGETDRDGRRRRRDDRKRRRLERHSK